VKAGWTSKPLEDACTFINGLWKGEKDPLKTVGVIRNTNFTKDGTLDDTDIAFIEVEVKKFDKRKLFAGDIILEKSGGGPKQAVGRVVLFDKPEGDYSFSNFTAAIRVKSPDELDAKYLHKFLHWTYLSGVTEGMQSNSTGIRNLDGDKYKAIQVSYPSIGNQLRIVTLLDEAFADIATAKANAEKNLQNARELFESHLDEVLGSQASDHIATTLGTEVDLVAGFAFSSSRYSNNENDIRLLRGDNIMQGYLRWEDVKRWPMSDRAAHGKFALKEGDVVLAMDRPWVKAGLKRAQMTATDLPCLQVQRTARLRTKQNLSADFLFHLTGSQAFSRHLLDVQTGIGVPHISGAQIQDFKFMRPPLAKQAMIATELQKLQEETQRLETIYRQKLTAFDDLKKSLLHQAFSGQL
jgi:type I restriction enzyme S subunit